ncbi:MAG TPA: hypothetical protein VLZ03_05115 [Thermodesulfobacteriota bacterium]|nr:hypothetical protein [Thermodesulfobacteriota bacterium]
MKTSFFCILLVCLQLILGCAAQQAEKIAPKNDLSSPLPQAESKPKVKTWDGSPNLEPGLNGDDILLFEDFEADDYQAQWPVFWGTAVGAGTVDAPSKYIFAGKRSGFLEVPKGSHGSYGYGEYVPRIPINDVVYVRMYLRLEDDFSMGTANQLKLFSIKGGSKPENAYGGAGTAPTGRDKFSVTLSLDGGRSLHFYLYSPDQWGGYGDWVYCQSSFFHKVGLSRGRWYCIELMLKNNTPGKKDGQIKAWLDGKRIGKVEKLRFRDVSDVKIRRLTVENYFGGDNYSDTSPKTQRLYIDNYVVSTKPIGCMAAER